MNGGQLSRERDLSIEVLSEPVGVCACVRACVRVCV